MRSVPHFYGFFVRGMLVYMSDIQQEMVAVYCDRVGERSDSAILLRQPTLSEARGHVGALFPTLSISDAERWVCHDRRVSDAPIHSVSSTRCGCHQRLPRLQGRTEALYAERLRAVRRLRGYKVNRQLTLRVIAGWRISH